jgi:hypothetical protein
MKKQLNEEFKRMQALAGINEIAVGNIARNKNSGSETALGVFKDTILKKIQMSVEDFKEPDFDSKNKVLYYTENKDLMAFITWIKPTNNITVDNNELKVDEWEADNENKYNRDIYYIIR